MPKTKHKDKDKAPHFDIYHFFSRKDVWLAGMLVLALLLLALWLTFQGNKVV